VRKVFLQVIPHRGGFAVSCRRLHNRGWRGEKKFKLLFYMVGIIVNIRRGNLGPSGPRRRSPEGTPGPRRRIPRLCYFFGSCYYFRLVYFTDFFYFFLYC
jgi:hypothetical protein